MSPAGGRASEPASEPGPALAAVGPAPEPGAAVRAPPGAVRAAAACTVRPGPVAALPGRRRRPAAASGLVRAGPAHRAGRDHPRHRPHRRPVDVDGHQRVVRVRVAAAPGAGPDLVRLHHQPGPGAGLHHVRRRPAVGRLPDAAGARRDVRLHHRRAVDDPDFQHRHRGAHPQRAHPGAGRPAEPAARLQQQGGGHTARRRRRPVARRTCSRSRRRRSRPSRSSPPCARRRRSSPRRSWPTARSSPGCRSLHGRSAPARREWG